MASETFTFQVVAKHNHKKDCWIIIDGKVYDVTAFLEEHPGGDEALLLAAEKDATDDFEDVGHSDSAKEMMQKYLIGKVDINTLPEKPSYRPPPPTQASAVHDQSSAFVLKILQFLVPLLILGFAFYLQYYGKKASPAKSDS